MSVTPLHKLALMISSGECIDDSALIESLGRESTVVVPLHGGKERRLPSGEILDVLAGGAGMTVEQVLSQSFCMDDAEIRSALDFFRLVQFTGQDAAFGDAQVGEQPFQALDR